MPSYTTLGNILHTIVLVTGLVYAAGVLHFTNPNRQGVVDALWKQEGFCIQNKEVPYWSSFDTCLYVDVFFSCLLGVLYYCWRDKLSMAIANQVVPSVIASTIGHGVAHGVQAHHIRSGIAVEDEDDPFAVTPLWQIAGFCAIFWFPLLKATMPKVAPWMIAVLAVGVTAGQREVRYQHSFTYVQTVVTITFHVSQLLLDAKEKETREYLTQPLFAATLPMLTAWNEALGCTAYVQSLGGHTLYDASIIVGFLTYYVDTYRYHSQRESVLLDAPEKKKIR